MKHYANTDGRLEHILGLPPNFPLLPRERKIVDKVRAAGATPSLACLEAWKLLGDVRRARVRECETFPHLDTEYIRQEVDAALGRDVVVLYSVCWLHFRKRFDKVDPGKRKIIIVRNHVWPTNGGDLFT